MIGGDIGEHIRIATFALPVVLLAFALHEMAHAYTATWFGDPTPARYGRRTINPIRHLDPMGTIMICVSMLLFGFPFGFAVTPVDDSKMRRPRLHGALVAFAGPFVNILICIASAIWFVVAVNRTGADIHTTLIRDLPVVVQAAYYSMTFNAFLAVFNLLPIPPLDGGRIVGSFMDDHTRREWTKLNEYGMYIIFGLIIVGGASFSQFLQWLQDHLLTVVIHITNALGFGIA
jgi:Zn-dependent protease